MRETGFQTIKADKKNTHRDAELPYGEIHRDKRERKGEKKEVESEIARIGVRLVAHRDDRDQVCGRYNHHCCKLASPAFSSK